jgi:hypothetical protein
MQRLTTDMTSPNKAKNDGNADDLNDPKTAEDEDQFS